MARFTPKTVTARDLRGGEALWLTEDDRWSQSPAEAELLEDEAHAQLRLLYAHGQRHRVAAPQLAEAGGAPALPARRPLRA